MVRHERVCRPPCGAKGHTSASGFAGRDGTAAIDGHDPQTRDTSFNGRGKNPCTIRSSHSSEAVGAGPDPPTRCESLAFAKSCLERAKIAPKVLARQ